MDKQIKKELKNAYEYKYYIIGLLKIVLLFVIYYIWDNFLNVKEGFIVLGPSYPTNAVTICPATATSCTFLYTNTIQTWTPPKGVTSATFIVIGGKGGYTDRTIANGTTGKLPSYKGGYGANVTATLPVSELTTYNIAVGGNADNSLNVNMDSGASGLCGNGTIGYNGSSGLRPWQNAGGGAASVVYTTSNSSPIIVASGGGGAGEFSITITNNIYDNVITNNGISFDSTYITSSTISSTISSSTGLPNTNGIQGDTTSKTGGGGGGGFVGGAYGGYNGILVGAKPGTSYVNNTTTFSLFKTALPTDIPSITISWTPTTTLAATTTTQQPTTTTLAATTTTQQPTTTTRPPTTTLAATTTTRPPMTTLAPATTLSPNVLTTNSLVSTADKPTQITGKIVNGTTNSTPTIFTIANVSEKNRSFYSTVFTNTPPYYSNSRLDSQTGWVWNPNIAFAYGSLFTYNQEYVNMTFPQTMVNNGILPVNGVVITGRKDSEQFIKYFVVDYTDNNGANQIIFEPNTTTPKKFTTTFKGGSSIDKDSLSYDTKDFNFFTFPTIYASNVSIWPGLKTTGSDLFTNVAFNQVAMRCDVLLDTSELTTLTTLAATTTTLAATTTTLAATTTTLRPTTTTLRPTTTTLAATTTTPYVPTTTPYVPTTTPYVPTTTPYVPTTTSYQNPTTTNSSSTSSTSSSSIQSIINDITSMFPSLSQSEITNLINSGVDISSLMNTSSTSISNDSTRLSKTGINLSSQFKGPSTNVVQVDFKGTSNIYSPYLYYNKGINEKFESIGKRK